MGKTLYLVCGSTTNLAHKRDSKEFATKKEALAETSKQKKDATVNHIEYEKIQDGRFIETIYWDKDASGKWSYLQL